MSAWRGHGLAALAAGLTLGALWSPALAHRTWMLPSATVVQGPEAHITVDAAVSENLFDFDTTALPLDAVTVTGPDGKPLPVSNASSGRRRSSFDVTLRAPGSYRLANVNETVFASYTVSGETKRWRGAPGAMAANVPADAQGLQITRMHQRVETFVALERAGGEPFVADGRGLELQTLTAPTDLAVGDTSAFRLLLDGQPAAGVQVTLVRGGNRYRYKLAETTLHTAGDGRFSVRWPEAGMYWMNVSVSVPRVESPGERPTRRASYSATFEVLPP